ncbi:hypothetical protein ABK040_004674 [Willaertia magna]
MVIELYSAPTPNGDKIGIALEEMGLEYNAHPINLSNNEQFNPDFLKISPNNKIPAIVDKEGPNGEEVALFESAAILIYLAEKSGKFIPTKGTKEYYKCLQWLAWQIGGLGPMSGQLYFFAKRCTEDIPLAKERFLKEVQRLLGVLDKELQDKDYVAGEYSIADMAIYPWVKPVLAFDAIGDYPNVVKYVERIGAREAVKRGSGLCKPNEQK